SAAQAGQPTTWSASSRRASTSPSPSARAASASASGQGGLLAIGGLPEALAQPFQASIHEVARDGRRPAVEPSQLFVIQAREIAPEGSRGVGLQRLDHFLDQAGT